MSLRILAVVRHSWRILLFNNVFWYIFERNVTFAETINELHCVHSWCLQIHLIFVIYIFFVLNCSFQPSNVKNGLKRSAFTQTLYTLLSYCPLLWDFPISFWCQSSRSLILRSFNARDLRFSRTMIYAIEEINNSTELLPELKLGYQIFDSCGSVPMAMHVAFQLANGQDSVFYKGINCSQSEVVMGAVGDSGSTPSIGMLRIIGSFNIPLVHFFPKVSFIIPVLMCIV